MNDIFFAYAYSFFRLQNDLYCVGYGVKLYLLTLKLYFGKS